MKDQAYSSLKKEAEIYQAAKSPHYIFLCVSEIRKSELCLCISPDEEFLCVISICSEGGEDMREVNKCGKGKYNMAKHRVITCCLSRKGLS